MKAQNVPFLRNLSTKASKYVLAVVVLLLIISLSRSVLRLKRARSRVAEAEIALEEVSERNNELKRQKQVVESEFFIEKQLRDNFGLAKEGEIVLVLPEHEILRRLSPRVENEEQNTLPDPNWKKWANLFI